MAAPWAPASPRKFNTSSLNYWHHTNHTNSSIVQAATQTKSATKTSPTAGSSTCTAGITCPGNDGCVYKANSKNFYARCNFDFYGGDMTGGSSKQTSLKNCVDKCSTTAGCVAVSYTTGGTCYMKNTLKPAVYSANVNGMCMNYLDGYNANWVAGVYVK